MAKAINTAAYTRRIDAALRATDSYPKRRAGQSVVGNLACLRALAERLPDSIDRFVALGDSGATGPRSERIMLDLAGHIHAVGVIARDLRPQLVSLCNSRIGERAEAEALILLKSSEQMIRTLPRGKKKK